MPTNKQQRHEVYDWCVKCVSLIGVYVCVYVEYLEHGPDVLQMCGAGEGCLDVADGLHQSLGRLGHLLHLHIVQQTPLLLAGHT